MNNKAGRFIIYGAGGIGGVIGGHLALAGNDVILIGRPDHMNAVRQQGLKLIKPKESYNLKVAAVTSPSEISFRSDDVILLTMKGQSTESAMHDLHEAVEEIPVICLQNGVRNEEIVSRIFPRTFGARINIGAVYMTPGEVICRRDPPGWIIMGCYPTGTNPLAEAVGASLRKASFYVLVTPDVMPFKWGKLMTNLGNAVGAITNDNSAAAQSITEAARIEAQQILKEADIRWFSEGEITRQWPDFGAKPRAAMTTEEQSSTWQSLSRQQGSVETAFLNGEIVRVARRIGKTAPINETIAGIIQDMATKKEKPGKYNATELRQILGLV